MSFRYKLAPYAGKDSRLICPNCGQQEFVPYIDTETGEIVDETCGRCNRESHCGYHLPPSQFFQNHPESRPRDDGRPASKGFVLCDHKEPDGANSDASINELPPEIIKKTVRMVPASNFVKFLDTIFDPVVTEGVVYLYNLGVTKAGETIFYQQDQKGRFRGGKVIQYNPETGHRIKDGEHPVRWVHQSFQRQGFIPKDWTMTQCLFGEHLLDQYPDKPVCLVEAEKTAVICAGLMPEFNWLATGGKTQLNERLNVLQGKKVIAFPDIDAFDAWMEYFRERSDLNVTVSDLLERNATDKDREAQIDIADLLIRWQQQGGD